MDRELQADLEVWLRNKAGEHGELDRDQLLEAFAKAVLTVVKPKPTTSTEQPNSPVEGKSPRMSSEQDARADSTVEKVDLSAGDVSETASATPSVDEGQRRSSGWRMSWLKWRRQNTGDGDNDSQRTPITENVEEEVGDNTSDIPDTEEQTETKEGTDQQRAAEHGVDKDNNEANQNDNMENSENENDPKDKRVKDIKALGTERPQSFISRLFTKSGSSKSDINSVLKSPTEGEDKEGSEQAAEHVDIQEVEGGEDKKCNNHHVDAEQQPPPRAVDGLHFMNTRFSDSDVERAFSPLSFSESPDSQQDRIAEMASGIAPLKGSHRKQHKRSASASHDSTTRTKILMSMSNLSRHRRTPSMMSNGKNSQTGQSDPYRPPRAGSPLRHGSKEERWSSDADLVATSSAFHKSRSVDSLDGYGQTGDSTEEMRIHRTHSVNSAQAVSGSGKIHRRKPSNSLEFLSAMQQQQSDGGTLDLEPSLRASGSTSVLRQSFAEVLAGGAGGTVFEFEEEVQCAEEGVWCNALRPESINGAHQLLQTLYPMFCKAQRIPKQESEEEEDERDFMHVFSYDEWEESVRLLARLGIPRGWRKRIWTTLIQHRFGGIMKTADYQTMDHVGKVAGKNGSGDEEYEKPGGDTEVVEKAGHTAATDEEEVGSMNGQRNSHGGHENGDTISAGKGRALEEDTEDGELMVPANSTEDNLNLIGEDAEHGQSQKDGVDKMKTEDDPRRVSDRDRRIQIEKDLHRTSTHEYFRTEKGRKVLAEVLFAYAHYNSSTGYCQSFNFIAARLLIEFDFDADFAFSALVLLLDRMPENFFKDLEALAVDMRVFDRLFEMALPVLYEHVAALSTNSDHSDDPLAVDIFAGQWFPCLFANVLPDEALFRVWDAIILDGGELMFGAALAIFALIGGHIETTCNFIDLYMEMKIVLAGLEHTIDPTELMDIAYSMFPDPLIKVERLRMDPEIQAAARARRGSQGGATKRKGPKGWSFKLGLKFGSIFNRSSQSLRNTADPTETPPTEPVRPPPDIQENGEGDEDVEEGLRTMNSGGSGTAVAYGCDGDAVGSINGDDSNSPRDNDTEQNGAGSATMSLKREASTSSRASRKAYGTN
eukprot:Clim_evm5s253 gene=Clim_evmTU5s253